MTKPAEPDPGEYGFSQVVLDIGAGEDTRPVAFPVHGYAIMAAAVAKAIGDEVFPNCEAAGVRINAELAKVPYPSGPKARAAFERHCFEREARLCDDLGLCLGQHDDECPRCCAQRARQRNTEGGNGDG